MRAIDTNILVRFLTRDDPAQATKASKVVEAGDLFVATTVLLEAEWVLRSAYGIPADRIVAALRAFAGLPGVALEDAPLAASALDLAETGMDFADALHLARAQGCTAFLTFDRRLVKRAAGVAGVEVLEP